MKKDIWGERATWPLGRCIRGASYDALKELQMVRYALELEPLDDPYREVESLKEIDRLMRHTPHYSKGGRWRG